jgi:hypothetical protein
MDNLKKPREHNYLKKILRLEAEGKFPPGTVNSLSIKHDDWCNLLVHNGTCNCDPEIWDGKKLIA